MKDFQGLVIDEFKTLKPRKTKKYDTYEAAHKAAEKLCKNTLRDRGRIVVHAFQKDIKIHFCPTCGKELYYADQKCELKIVLKTLESPDTKTEFRYYADESKGIPIHAGRLAMAELEGPFILTRAEDSKIAFKTAEGEWAWTVKYGSLSYKDFSLLTEALYQMRKDGKACDISIEIIF